MKLVIDARMLRSSGIGTYLQAIIEGLTKSSHHIHLLTEKEISAPLYTIEEHLQLYAKIPSCDLFWSPHFITPLLPIKAKKRITTFHDLFHLDYLSSFSLPKRLYIKFMTSQAALRSDALITVSSFSQERLFHYFPKARFKTSVIYSGCNHLDSLSPVSGLSIAAPFLLFVGNLKPHKNLAAVLQALEEFPSLHLVIVGKQEGFLHGINLPDLLKTFSKIKEQIHFTGIISNQELKWLYLKAEALVFPSLYEGWGLPPLEAMRLKCPVLASSLASIPEACGEGACYFNPHLPGDLSRQLRHLLEHKNHYVEKGWARASSFCWDKTATAHLQLFEKLVDS